MVDVVLGELEELVFKSIQADSTAGHHAVGKKADTMMKLIFGRVNGIVYPANCGKIKQIQAIKDLLIWYCHRLGRFKATLI